MTTNATTTAARPPAATTAAPADAPAGDRFPDYPPRDDMMNTRHLHDYGNQPALRLYLGRPETTIVLGEVPIAWDIPRGRDGVRIPDLLVARNVNAEQILNQMGYAIRQHGKAPDFVLEVASDTTSRRDETVKWRDYAAFGVTEYWLFDPDWGQRYEQGLIGWTLVNEGYEPIAIREYAADMRYGYSAVLGLYVCWEYGRLRWYDAETGYLRSHDEERNGRIAYEILNDAFATERDAAVSERDVAVSERDVAAAERDTATAERDAAATERDAAVSERDAERNARLAAEAEVQRLRDEIARRGAGGDGA